MYFQSFVIIFPLEKGYPLLLYKLESLSPKNELYQVWLKMAQWFWRRRFLNNPSPFLHFSDYLPFEENLALYFNNFEFPVSKDDLYQVWLKLACWFWRRRFLYKYSFPYCDPSRPSGTMMWTILNLHYIRKLSCKYKCCLVLISISVSRYSAFRARCKFWAPPLPPRFKCRTDLKDFRIIN